MLKPVNRWLKKHPKTEFAVGAVIYSLPDPIPGPFPGFTDPVAVPLMVDGVRRMHKGTKPLSFYTDHKKRVRPITPSSGIRRSSLRKTGRTSVLSVPSQSSITRNTLANPLLRANHLRWIRENVDPDSYDKIDWASEVDRIMTPSESRDALRVKYPEAFIETRPNRSDIRERMKREKEIEQLYRDYEASFEKKEPATKREKTVRKIRTRMEKLPPERRAKILRDKPRLRREPLLREIVIKTKSGRKYTRVQKIWKY